MKRYQLSYRKFGSYNNEGHEVIEADSLLEAAKAYLQANRNISGCTLQEDPVASSGVDYQAIYIAKQGDGRQIAIHVRNHDYVYVW